MYPSVRPCIQRISFMCPSLVPLALEPLLDPWIHLWILAHKVFLSCCNNYFSYRTTLESTFITITLDPKLINECLEKL